MSNELPVNDFQFQTKVNLLKMATGKKSWENLLVTIYKFYKRILGTYFGQF